MMSPEFESLYHRHALTSYEKQLRLADVIGTRSWRFSMEDGALTFDEDGGAPRPSTPIVFAAQLLGTVAYNDSTWLWSWANEASQIPPALTHDARRLRDSGPAAEWTTSQFALELNRADEHRLAMASSGLLAADAFYRGPYAGGAAFFMLHDERLRLPVPEGPRVVRTITEAISQGAIANHRAAIMSYFTERGLQPRADGEDAILAMLSGRALRADFDAQGRLAKLGGTFGP
jgi:uncharacterized protein DUF6882